jgi:1,4-alpha-glucan branching enzyme
MTGLSLCPSRSLRRADQPVVVSMPVGAPFALVLHMHLPMVLNHGRWPHGSDWLCEAAFECYLPILEAARTLVGEGLSPRWTINMSPVLTEQLRSPDFQRELEFYLDNVRRACADSRAHFLKENNAAIAALADHWLGVYERMWDLHRRIGGDIPRAYGDLQRAGHIELITCAATHGYFPLLGREESIHLQLRTAIETHRRHFGVAPRGIWLPECAYRPRYEWTPPIGRDRGRERRMRPGVEEMLAAHGIEYFVADHHLVAGGEPIFPYRDFYAMPGDLSTVESPPAQRTRPRSAYRPYRVASRGGKGQAVAFIRDPKTTLQVWSREVGYPGDPAYLEFHKKHFPGGLRFWRVTDASGDLGTKAIYEPPAAAEQVKRHADHFVALVRQTLDEVSGKRPALVCSPYDAELFGHWWFEGPQWMTEVVRRFKSAGIVPMTLAEALDAVPPRETLALPEGSWGEGGDHRVWLNRDTEWTWDRVYSAENEWVQHLAWREATGAEVQRVLAQATRELLFLEASDWQFLITTWSARDYAERRVAEHYAEFKRLSEFARRLQAGEALSADESDGLSRLERQDFCFPELEAAWATGAPATRP